MAEYSYNEIMKMQNDAIKRVNEMQKKAQVIMNKEKLSENASSEPVKKEKNSQVDSVKRIKMPNDYLNDLREYASTSSYYENEENERVYEKKPAVSAVMPIKTDSVEDKLKNLLGDFSLDSDKALILSLIMLLTEEKADEMLILALLYLLT